MVIRSFYISLFLLYQYYEYADVSYEKLENKYKINTSLIIKKHII
jgi:hypothetical protein